MSRNAPTIKLLSVPALLLLGACTVVRSGGTGAEYGGVSAVPQDADVEFMTSIGPGWAYAREGGGFVVRLPSVGEFNMPGEELTASFSDDVPSTAGPVDFTVIEYRSGGCERGYIGVLATQPTPQFYKLGDCKTQLSILRRDNSGDPVGLLETATDRPVYAIYPDRVALLDQGLAPAPLPGAKPDPNIDPGASATARPASPAQPFEVPPIGRLEIE
ncbi:MAG: hypothetical protein KI792_03455 [Alphaproteobacteria bacterium]|nr:hypothetical protein [Alphaproteobacteria bacterium SS10]